MDVNEHRVTIELCTRHKLKKKEKRLLCCSSIYSYNRIFNNEHSMSPKMSVKQSVACSWSVLISIIWWVLQSNIHI